MKITDEDRSLYSSAVDFLYEKIEISREFVKHNGMSSLPVEELTDIIIIGIKDWLLSDMGEHWLGTIGYERAINITISGYALTDYSIMTCSSGTILTYFCPVCSGSFPYMNMTSCERCGRQVCQSCSSIMDDYYGVGWCHNCIE